MRAYDTPYTSDWFVVSFRWLIIIGLVVSLSLGSELILRNVWPLALMAAWNVAMTLMASMNLRISYHRYISLAIDLLAAGALFWEQGGFAGPAAWAALLPVLTGTMFFEFWGALIAASLSAAIQIAITSQLGYGRPGMLIAIGASLVTVLGSLLFGFLGNRLHKGWAHLREQRFQTERARDMVESERLRAIYDLTSTLTATLNYRRVLDSALDLSVSALNSDPATADDRMVSAVLLFKGNDLQVGSARRFTPADARTQLGGNEGLLGKVFTDGEPVLTSNVGFDPELGRVIALRACTSAYCFPLRSGFSMYGAMLFAHPDPNYFSPDRREILEIIGRQAVIAIQNARLYQDLVDEKERMIEVQEEARKKLARDLHDGPTQSVAAIAMRINMTRRMMAKDVSTADAELVKIEDLAHRTTKEIRHMLFTLRPLVLESQGLTAALQAMAEKTHETFSQNVTINVDEGVADQLEMGKQGVIFYIAEEAVNNARKHAKASTIAVRLKRIDHGLVLLEIQDDGVGFDVKAVTDSYDKRGSLGMINLRERTELVNGLLHIDSVPGRGTRVQIFIPLTEEAADRLHHGK